MNIRETTMVPALVHDKDSFDYGGSGFLWTACGLYFARDDRRYDKAEVVETDDVPTSCLWCIADRSAL